jgi:N-acetylglucosaminyldiphosphoundecaprenol N-acetyl-beta-D-mannosaminyltransferase
MIALQEDSRVDILGYHVSHVRDMDEAVQLAEELVLAEGFHQIILGNIFCAIHAQHDPIFREATNTSALTIADGISLVWASRLLGDPVGKKVFGWDFFEELTARAAEKGYSIFLIGGWPPEGSERVAEAFKAQYPTIRIVGTYTPGLGPIEEEENDRIVDLVNAAQPDILWVGLGSPRQEVWIWSNRKRLNTHVAAAVGAAFEHQMGRQKRMPRWMDNLGLGWLHRVTQDPSVLWRKRYDQYFPQFVLPVLWLAARKKLSRVLGRA